MADTGGTFNPFEELSELRQWVPSDSEKCPCNIKGKRFNEWSDSNTELMTYAEAKATAKQYGLPYTGLIFPATGINLNGDRLLCIDVDELTGYRKARKATRTKEAVTAVTFDPDKDDVLAMLPLVNELPPTLCEASGSHTGGHIFLKVPEDQAAPYWGKRHAKLAGCDHADTFMAGRKAQHLIVTEEWLGTCRTIARLDSISPLVPLFNPANHKGPAIELEIPEDGTAFDFNLPWLSEGQRNLVEGAGQIDRSAILHGLLIALLDAGKKPADLLVSFIHCNPLAEYLLDHRNQDPIKALEFGRYEIGRAYRKSEVGMRARLKGFNDAWADGNFVGGDTLGEIIKPLCEPLPDFMADYEQQVWLIEHILELGTHNAMLGHPGAGKTAVTLDMALHIAFGMNLGRFRVKRARVVYIAGEDPKGVKRRIKLWCQKCGKDFAEVKDWFFVIRRPVLDNKDDVERLRAELQTIKPGLMVVDTFSENYGGESEDKATDVKKWFRMIRQDFIAAFGCCVVTLHHPPKGSSDLHNWRGSGAAKGEIDNTFAVALDDDRACMSLGKNRGADFSFLYWDLKKEKVKGELDNFGNEVVSVFASLVDGPTMPNFDALICKTIEVFNKVGRSTSVREIAEFSGVPKSTVDYRLKQLKLKKQGERTARLLADGDGYRLTKKGTELAAFAMVDRDFGSKVAALLEDARAESEA